ncbi:YdiU family protein [Phyllobacterium sp. SYP-B3895]|uniref:protein adenylyltransferase SelO n=1 Tax=Phyllobacterium sp. SYP-B3895 TaxID=2663240 RepID=UPI00129956DA|nr:YdiU family protein [Phyllobacterium sp. SYP-B3895]MRG58052.1 YdiU family protein [Phyllobacterium sp. SYP-B3895]
MSKIEFDHTYSRLPDKFFIRTLPTPVASPRLIKLNHDLARQLGLEDQWLCSAEGIDMLAGNNIPQGAHPIATAYAGHQFGHFVPRLGDGRAILLGEVIDRNGVRRDIQLKGSGRTPFSRGGDGRAALGPVLREYILSEAMNALRIPTTRALAAVLTGETVARETSLPGAVLTRVASSHIRIGTFQFFAARGDFEGVRTLADHVIARHYPSAAEAEMPYLSLLAEVIGVQASLVAQWMLAGFIHGVMNTDNMSIAGETIDYGPCAFLDNYDPATVFSSIDHAGRYAYGNQGPVALWNLVRLAETLLPLLADDQDRAVSLAQNALATFDAQFEAVFITGMRSKLGLFTEEENDLTLIKELLDIMTRGQADFTLTFRYLSHSAGNATEDEELLSLFAEPGVFVEWLARWRSRISREAQTGSERRNAMLHVNPRFIPRNHRVEAVITAAVRNNDFRPFEELLAVLGQPFEDQPEFAHYADPPKINERVLQTFCGT